MGRGGRVSCVRVWGGEGGIHGEICVSSLHTSAHDLQPTSKNRLVVVVDIGGSAHVQRIMIVLVAKGRLSNSGLYLQRSHRTCSR